MCQGCVLRKRQLPGMRVLSLAAIYPDKLRSVDLFCPRALLGLGQAHTRKHIPSAHTHLCHASLSVSPARVRNHIPNLQAGDTAIRPQSGLEGRNTGLALCLSPSGLEDLGTAAHTIPHRTAGWLGTVRAEQAATPGNHTQSSA